MKHRASEKHVPNAAPLAMRQVKRNCGHFEWKWRVCGRDWRRSLARFAGKRRDTWQTLWRHQDGHYTVKAFLYSSHAKTHTNLVSHFFFLSHKIHFWNGNVKKLFSKYVLWWGLYIYECDRKSGRESFVSTSWENHVSSHGEVSRTAARLSGRLCLRISGESNTRRGVRHTPCTRRAPDRKHRKREKQAFWRRLFGCDCR